MLFDGLVEFALLVWIVPNLWLLQRFLVFRQLLPYCRKVKDTGGGLRGERCTPTQVCLIGFPLYPPKTKPPPSYYGSGSQINRFSGLNFDSSQTEGFAGLSDAAIKG